MMNLTLTLTDRKQCIFEGFYTSGIYSAVEGGRFCVGRKTRALESSRGSREKTDMERGTPGSGSGSAAKKRRKENKKRRQKAVKTAANTLSSATNTSSVSAVLLEEGSKVDAVDSQDCSNPRRDDGQKRVFSGKKRPREADGSGPLSFVSKHPFPTEYGDHFETPLQAYRDVEGALALLAKRLGKKRKHLRIWDPYVSAEASMSCPVVITPA